MCQDAINRRINRILHAARNKSGSTMWTAAFTIRPMADQELSGLLFWDNANTYLHLIEALAAPLLL